MPKSVPIIHAAQQNDIAKLEKLLAEGADAKAKDSEGRTALHHAVMRGYLEVVDRLTEHAGPALLLEKDILGCTPVHLAAVQNQVTLILKLVNALLKDEDGTTPLHVIARQRCMQDFMGFLHLGWDVATKNERESTIVTEETPAWEAVGRVIDLNRPGLAIVRQTMSWKPLHMAAMGGNVPLIRELVLEHGCDLLCRSANSWTPLHYAAAYNQIPAIKALVELGCSVSTTDSVHSTPIHVAAGEGHIDAVMTLYRLGCDPKARDRDGCTPLYCAAAWNRIDAVRRLHELGCPSHAKSEEGRTPIHVAAEQGWVDLIDLLVRTLKNKVDVPDSYQFTPLHAAANGGHVPTIRKLIHFTHDIDVVDYLGRTPLHYAAMHGRVGAIVELVAKGASVKATDARGGYTPLHLAADAGQCESIRKLLSLGATLEARTTKGWTPLVLATMKGPANVDAIGTLVELGANVNAVTEANSLETPLHIAARSGRVDVVEKLLLCGVKLMSRTKDGSTPLHYAAAFGQAAVILALVRAGTPVDVRDNASNTPLHLAAGCGFLEAIDMLVSLGGDLNARDITSCTPLQNASHGTYSALAAMPAGGQGTSSSTGLITNGYAGAAAGSTGGSVGSAAGGSGQHLTASQQAAQAAMTNSAARSDGLVPVRTGLAWAALGEPLASPSNAYEAGQNDVLANWCGLTAQTPEGTPPHAAAGANWRGLGLMQLLKRASKRRSTALPATALDLPSSSGLGAGSMKERDWEFGLEALLRKTEALQLSSMEQDRNRLLPVAKRLVELGADLDATDAEGRTALHLAAGCGDRSMVVQLVQLGSDINCRDSVGGTAMHHAAMANKREMMLTLARLGCDYRAKAEGIDGATAAYVLCGQHGKTTQQQTGLNILLKKAYKEGQALRAAGRDPLAGEALAGSAVAHTGAAARATAEANMVALLEELELEEEGKQKKRKKKRRAHVEGAAAAADEAADPAVHGNGPAAEAGEAAAVADVNGHAAPAAPQPDVTAAAAQQPQPPPQPAAAAAAAAAPAPQQPLEASQQTSAAVATVSAAASDAASSSAAAEAPNHADLLPPEAGDAPSVQEQARAALDEAVMQATTMLDIGTAAGDDTIQHVLDTLDRAIQHATEQEVSAKYAKKVRKRLAGLMQQPPPAEEPQPQQQLQRPADAPPVQADAFPPKAEQPGIQPKQAAPQPQLQSSDTARAAAASSTKGKQQPAGQTQQPEPQGSAEVQQPSPLTASPGRRSSSRGNHDARQQPPPSRPQQQQWHRNSQHTNAQDAPLVAKAAQVVLEPPAQRQRGGTHQRRNSKQGLSDAGQVQTVPQLPPHSQPPRQAQHSRRTPPQDAPSISRPTEQQHAQHAFAMSRPPPAETARTPVGSHPPQGSAGRPSAAASAAQPPASQPGKGPPPGFASRLSGAPPSVPQGSASFSEDPVVSPVGHVRRPSADPAQQVWAPAAALQPQASQGIPWTMQHSLAASGVLGQPLGSISAGLPSGGLGMQQLAQAQAAQQSGRYVAPPVAAAAAAAAASTQHKDDSAAEQPPVDVISSLFDDEAVPKPQPISTARRSSVFSQPASAGVYSQPGSAGGFSQPGSGTASIAASSMLTSSGYPMQLPLLSSGSATAGSPLASSQHQPTSTSFGGGDLFGPGMLRQPSGTSLFSGNGASGLGIGPGLQSLMPTSMHAAAQLPVGGLPLQGSGVSNGQPVQHSLWGGSTPMQPLVPPTSSSAALQPHQLSSVLGAGFGASSSSSNAPAEFPTFSVPQHMSQPPPGFGEPASVQRRSGAFTAPPAVSAADTRVGQTLQTSPEQLDLGGLLSSDLLGQIGTNSGSSGLSSQAPSFANQLPSYPRF